MKGKFIVFEGIDGSGKTTVSKATAERLKSHRTSVLWHREPTDGKIGLEIRKFLRKEIYWSKQEQLDAFFLDRRDSIDTTIEPNLKNGVHIVQDRYFYSTAAYQGNAEFSPQSILERSLQSGFPVPDYLFFLDIDPKEAEKRREKRNESKEAFDDLILQEQIYSNYQKILPSSTIRLDARRTPEELVEECMERLK